MQRLMSWSKGGKEKKLLVTIFLLLVGHYIRCEKRLVRSRIRSDDFSCKQNETEAKDPLWKVEAFGLHRL